jgi:DNA-binding protein Fis
LAQATAERAITTRPPSWETVREALAAVAAALDSADGCLADRVDALLLDVVVDHVPAQLSYAASLLDLSTPTLKRRLAARAQSRG